MMGKLPTVEVSLIKSCLQYTQRGSNPMPIPGRHQASVRGGNPVDFLMFSAIQTLSARQSHHRGSQKVYCGSQHTRVLGRHSSFIAQLRRCHGSQGASSARAHTGKTCSRLPLDGALSAEVFGIFEKKSASTAILEGKKLFLGFLKKKSLDPILIALRTSLLLRSNGTPLCRSNRNHNTLFLDFPKAVLCIFRGITYLCTPGLTQWVR